ncbi:LuxR C-terminal-related transcriptional regulator [Phytohabitans houttuyneae]|uniref:LuxR C-terminal-related transcriptional regulator n=1 Tax=Phytohabitans houttuyneae TaxID=1076126 RepID=UPI001563B5F7
MVGGWPLIGRSEELQVIDAVLGRENGLRGVVLAGAAGVGKTRLAREALEGARRRGMTGRWVTGSVSARTLPLGAFAAVLPWVGSDPMRALGQAADALLAGAGQAGALVVVDDGHLLDEVSATLVHQLAAGTAATVVVTVRTGEPVPDAVTAVWKDAHLDRLEVVPLSQPQTAELLEAALGGPVDTAAVARMWRLSRGNPLYLRELVAGERAAGQLAQRDGLWRWAGEPALSAKLVELVEARMGRLPEPVRDVVDLLAFAGDLEVDVLGRLVDAAALEGAETSALITVDTDRGQLSASLTHPLYGEARRARTGAFRARQLRRRIVGALLETGPRGADDELRCAALMVDSDFAVEPGLLMRAANRAAQLLDLPLAIRLGRVAFAHGGGFAAKAIVAQGLSMQGRGAEAEVELRLLSGLADTDALRAWAAAVRAGNLFFTLNHPTHAEQVLGEAMTAISDQPAREILWALHAVFEGLLARPGEAARAAGVVLDAPRPQPNAEFLASWGLVAALGVTGRADNVGPVAARGFRAGVSFDTAVLWFNLAEAELMALRLAGYLPQAEALAARCRQQAADIPGVPQLMAAALTGHAELARGRLRDAVRWMREALTGFTAIDPGGRVFDGLLWLTQAWAMAGNADAAAQTLERLAANHHTGFRYRETDVILARAWVAAAQGALSQAIALTREAAAAAAHLPACEVLALQTAVRFGDRTTAGRLAVLAAEVDGPRAQLAAAHAAALAADDGHALRAVSTRLEQTGDWMAAADAAAQAAAAHARAKKADLARMDGGRAHLLAHRCQGARTPAILSAARPLPITTREREIITLASRGLTNRDIARRLGLSVRTVEGHLYRVGAKLGITRRADLADLLSDDGPQPL